MSRLAGHELWAEGAAFVMDRDRSKRRPTRVRAWTTSGEGFAVCSCGAQSPVFTTAAARKRWHREHKDQWRKVDA